VSGTRAGLYDDTKRVLQVPWMGVVTMAFAYYQTFYTTLWEGLRGMAASEAFVGACADLRHDAEARVAALDPPPIVGRLSDAGYAPREIDAIRDMIEVFSHGNMPYCLLATLTRLALEAEFLPKQSESAEFLGRHAPDVDVPFILIEAHHADPPTRQVYDDIKATLALPFVNTDYRALARWPSFFSLAWSDLKPLVGTPGYDQTVAAVHAEFTAAARAMPNPSGLTAATLREAAEKDASLEEILSVVRLFQWLLPGLITNVAFFRHQLLD
jgi:hypothetical protein